MMNGKRNSSFGRGRLSSPSFNEGETKLHSSPLFFFNQIDQSE